MQVISDVLVNIGEASIYTVWMPFFIWTLASTCFLLMLNLKWITHPAYQYTCRLSLLFALPLAILSPTLLSFSMMETTVIPVSGLWAEGIFEVTQSNASTEASFSWVMFSLGLLTAFGVALAFGSLLKLTLNYLALRRLRCTLLPVTDPHENDIVRQASEKLLTDRPLSVRKSSDTTVPFTFGWLKPVIVLPAHGPSAENLFTILTHEIVHIKRRDYLAKCLQEFIKASFRINPLVSYISRDLDDYREMCCDAEVLTYKTTTRKSYATLLLDISGASKLSNPLVSAMAHPKSQLKRRIIAMSTFTNNPENTIMQKSNIIVSVIAAGLIVSLASCEFQQLESDSKELPPETEEQQDGDLFQVVESMPEPVGGIESIYNNLTYPDEARRAGIEGRVSVQFTVGTDGQVSDAQVLRGIGGGADEEALNAIQSTEWIPGEQRGQVVPVRFVYTVQFRLN